MVGKIVIAILIGFCVAVTILPLLMMLSVSLQSDAEIFSSAPVLVPAVPQFVNYATMLASGDWARYFFNSAYVAVVTTAVSLTINAMAGFVFARVPFRFSGVLFVLVLVGMMIPPQVTMIPVFTMLRRVPFVGGNDWMGLGGRGLYNTLSGLILPYIAGSFGVFFCRQYYVSFPTELDDSAHIDGCGRFGTFIHIYLPLSGPLLASLGILKFTGTWNEYTWPLIMTRTDEMKTVQLALASFRNESGIAWHCLMGAALLVSLPVYAAFAAAQRHFVSGLLAGSVKA